MAYRCDICGKTKQYGHNVSFSQRKTNRVWKPNLQIKRMVVDGARLKLKVCAQCLRRLKAQQSAVASDQKAVISTESKAVTKSRR